MTVKFEWELREKFNDKDKFKLMDDALDRAEANQNIARLKWIGEKPEGREFSEINDSYSVYRENIIRAQLYGTDRPITQDLKYDLRMNYVEFIPFEMRAP